MSRTIRLKINDRDREVAAEPDRPLLGVLRDELDLTGSKYGCGEGQCGACTVLVDGQAVRSCLAKVSALAGKAITTIEGLALGDELHPLQQAFLDQNAMQCAYCTPGMIVAGAALLGSNPEPTDAQIVKAMQGNICRCGTYPRIVAAVRQAAESIRRGGAR